MYTSIHCRILYWLILTTLDKKFPTICIHN